MVKRKKMIDSLFCHTFCRRHAIQVTLLPSVESKARKHYIQLNLNHRAIKKRKVEEIKTNTLEKCYTEVSTTHITSGSSEPTQNLSNFYTYYKMFMCCFFFFSRILCHLEMIGNIGHPRLSCVPLFKREYHKRTLQHLVVTRRTLHISWLLTHQSGAIHVA